VPNPDFPTSSIPDVASTLKLESHRGALTRLGSGEQRGRRTFAIRERQAERERGYVLAVRVPGVKVNKRFIQT
jgi:hypothetical protein